MDFDSISIAIGKDAPWQSLFREHNLNVELIPTTQDSVQHLPFPVAFSCETNKNGDYAAGSTLLIQ